MRSFYGGASNQGAAMPGRMSAGVVTPGKSSPRGYLDYAARADTSLAKGVAILRQLPSRATALSVASHANHALAEGHSATHVNAQSTGKSAHVRGFDSRRFCTVP